MKVLISRLVLSLGVVFGLSTLAHAGSVNIHSTGADELVKSVNGIWAANEKVSFLETGTYTMTLSDLSFGNVFDQIGVMVSTSVHAIADIVITNGSVNRESITFNINKGEYWLSMFAIGSNRSVGTFGVDFTEGNLAPVPVPPAIVFMITSLLGLVSFARQRKINKKD